MTNIHELKSARNGHGRQFLNGICGVTVATIGTIAPANVNHLPMSRADQREGWRLGIMLDWWEDELRALIKSKVPAKSPAYAHWRKSLDEAQARVFRLRGQIAMLTSRAGDL